MEPHLDDLLESVALAQQPVKETHADTREEDIEGIEQVNEKRRQEKQDQEKDGDIILEYGQKLPGIIDDVAAVKSQVVHVFAVGNRESVTAVSGDQLGAGEKELRAVGFDVAARSPLVNDRQELDLVVAVEPDKKGHALVGGEVAFINMYNIGGGNPGQRRIEAGFDPVRVVAVEMEIGDDNYCSGSYAEENGKVDEGKKDTAFEDLRVIRRLRDDTAGQNMKKGLDFCDHTNYDREVRKKNQLRLKQLKHSVGNFSVY